MNSAADDAWLEAVFYRTHVRTISRSGAFPRRLLEWVLLAVAMGGCAVLYALHSRFGPTSSSNDFIRSLGAVPALREADAVSVSLGEGATCAVAYWFSREKGVVELSAAAKAQLGVVVHDVALDPSSLGGSLWLAAAGLDVAVVNAAVQSFGPEGHVRVEGSGHIYDLSRAQRHTYGRVLSASKLVVALKAVFIIFATSTLVAYILRETQARMLRFAYLIKQRVGHRKSYLSVRSLASLRHVPHLVALYLGLLHVYLFAFPFGFAYVALFSAVAAIAHTMLFFWNHYEIPAVRDGSVNSAHPRMTERASF